MPGFSTGGTELSREQRQTSAFAVSGSKVRVMWVGWLLVALALLFSPAAAQAQYTATALYNFCPQSGCADGGNPTSPPLFDTHGNIYGVASIGGANNKGVVYQLTPSGGTWSESVLYDFCSQSNCTDGQDPYYPLALDSQGNLYGTTIEGGSANGGVVYELSPHGGSWTESVLYNICSSNPCPDGWQFYGGLIIDTHGNLYGVALVGGAHNSGGTVFELSPSGGGSWTFSVLYNFCTLTNCVDGLQPKGGLIFDSHGNLYGTTSGGGANNSGVVFELSPSGGGSWTESVLYNFCPVSGCADGAEPLNALVQDAQGNLYGTANSGGANSPYGAVFELSPAGGGSWTEQVLVSFCPSCPNGYGPMGVAIDPHGDVFGNTAFGGNNGANRGTVYELSPGSGGQFSFNVIYTFCPGENCSNQGGGEPLAGIILDAQGNIYGANAGGGLHSEGAVYELSPVPLISTTTTLGTAPNPSNLNQTVTMTATVTAHDGSLPTGTVDFNSDGTQIGSATLNGSGKAVLNYSTLSGGSHNLTAVYQGNTTLAGSTSNTVVQVVNRATSTTTVTSAPNPSTVGQSVTITATISPTGPPVPTGTVGFTSNGTAISGCTAVTVSSHQAVCMTSALPVGTDGIVATYSGDSSYGGSNGSLTQIVNPVPSAVQFVPLTPCRIVDTRRATGTFGGPAITGGSARAFPLAQSGNPCGIPSTAVAYSLNVTVVPVHTLGYLTIWPTGEGQPTVSTLNSPDGRIKANAAIIPAGSSSGSVSVYVTDTTNVVLDIDGYFTTSSDSTLEFFPLTPCRVADTRKSNGDLGGPSLVGKMERDFPVLESACGLPSAAVAYSFNFTVVPTHTLGYLTVWPAGQSQPLVSTLNDLTGTIVANAAIVPAGTGGAVATYVSDNTDLIIDTNGYFAPAGSGGLSLYVLTPCRVLDTRKGNGAFNGEITVPVETSFCALPASAQGYVFNGTVVPQGPLGYLTLWPDGEDKPTVSTLNALDGAITSNMAIVPTTNGEIDAFASGTTQLVLDISSYFAP